jgi:hypothetical protein
LTLILVVVLQPVANVYEITVAPEATPVTTPEASTAAIPEAPLLHVPPPVVLKSVTAPSTHIATLPPEIEAGNGFTETSAVTAQPVPNVYVIVEVPASTPVTVPVKEPTVATAVLLLAQVPPTGLAESVVEARAHTVNVPDIALGRAVTESVRVTKHPVVVFV